jgi:hypothetical protein
VVTPREKVTISCRVLLCLCLPIASFRLFLTKLSKLLYLRHKLSEMQITEFLWTTEKLMKRFPVASKWILSPYESNCQTINSRWDGKQTWFVGSWTVGQSAAPGMGGGCSRLRLSLIPVQKYKRNWNVLLTIWMQKLQKLLKHWNWNREPVLLLNSIREGESYLTDHDFAGLSSFNMQHETGLALNNDCSLLKKSKML